VGSDELERDDTGGESVETDKGIGGEERERGRGGEECGGKEKAKREYMERRRKRASCRRIRYTKILYLFFQRELRSVRTIVHGTDR